MKRRNFIRHGALLVPPLLWLPRKSSAQFLINPYAFAAPGGGGTPIYGPVDMEATGAESGWSTIAGSPNWDATAQFKNGAQSLELPAGATVKSPTNDNGQITWKFWMRADSLPASDANVMAAYSGDFSQAFVIQITSIGLLKLATATSVTTVDGLSADVWYFVTCVFAKGTGADGVGTIGFSTDGSSPSSGNKYASHTHETTLNLPNNYFYGAQHTFWYDDISATTP